MTEANGHIEPEEILPQIVLTMTPREDGSGLMDVAVDHNLASGLPAVGKCLLAAYQIVMEQIIREQIKAETPMIEVPGLVRDFKRMH